MAETLCAASGFKPVKSPFFGLGLPYQAKLSAVQAQAYNHALQWLDKQNPASIKCNEGCTCAAKSGVIDYCMTFSGNGSSLLSRSRGPADPTRVSPVAASPAWPRSDRINCFFLTY